MPPVLHRQTKICRHRAPRRKIPGAGRKERSDRKNASWQDRQARRKKGKESGGITIALRNKTDGKSVLLYTRMYATESRKHQSSHCRTRKAIAGKQPRSGRGRARG